MAGPTSRKKKFIVRLELGAKGLLATGVVCLCVLLWMFLLGIWAGDHLVSSGGGVDDDLAPVAMPVPLEDHPQAATVTNAAPIAEPIPPPAPKPRVKRGPARKISPRAAKVSRKKEKMREVRDASPKATDSGSFFTLQVGAYREKAHALEECARLKARDLAAFYREPEPGRGKFTRVYIGRYATMDDARAAGSAIAADKGVKSFVVMIPGRAAGR